MKTLKCILLFVSIFAATAAPAKAAEPANSKSSLDNLMTAYGRASNQQINYIGYAVKADKEGYRSVAQIFRDASKSEGIVAGLFAKSIIKLGGKPQFEKKINAAGSTQKNIQNAVDSDGYEVDKLYPKFISTAEAENKDNIKHLFNTTMLVKSNQMALLKNVLAEPDSWSKTAKARFACQACGNMNDPGSSTNCPICGAYEGDYHGPSKHP